MNNVVSISKKIAFWKSGLALTGIEFATIATLILHTIPNDGRQLINAFESGSAVIPVLVESGKGLILAVLFIEGLRLTKKYVNRHI